MEIGGGTKVFAILGDPVAHSLSPAMQNAAFRALGLDAIYVPLRCEAAALGAVMWSLARQGGGGNVTLPYKTAAAEVLAEQGQGGERVGICNTFWGGNGRLEGTETDSRAIVAALTRVGPPGNRWLVIGTGGSGYAALLAARRCGAKVAVRSRDASRAREFERVALSLDLSLTPEAEPDVVLNCTPLGLSPDDPLPFDPALVPEQSSALDLVYRRGETAWVRALRALGRRAADGREVLLEQGAAAFEHWFPGRGAPREVMRAVVRTALE